MESLQVKAKLLCDIMTAIDNGLKLKDLHKIIHALHTMRTFTDRTKSTPVIPTQDIAGYSKHPKIPL